MSTYVKLPKNITYNSTMNDVIKAYGEPEENELSSDSTYQSANNTKGEYFGAIECYRLVYMVRNDSDSWLRLSLKFNKDTKKLYRVDYETDVNK